MPKDHKFTIRNHECYCVHPHTHADRLLTYIGIEDGWLRILNGPADGWENNPDAQRTNWRLDCLPSHARWPIDDQHIIEIDIDPKQQEVAFSLPDNLWARLNGQFHSPWKTPLFFQQFRKGDFRTTGFPRYHRSPNGGSWCRVIAIAFENNHDTESAHSFIEVDLTVANRWDQEAWARVRAMNFRLHCTSRSFSGGEEVDELPAEVRTLMEQNLAPEIIEQLLREDFFPLIDWDKLVLAPSGRGGTSLADIRCD